MTIHIEIGILQLKVITKLKIARRYKLISTRRLVAVSNYSKIEKELTGWASMIAVERCIWDPRVSLDHSP